MNPTYDVIIAGSGVNSLVPATIIKKVRTHRPPATRP